MSATYKTPLPPVYDARYDLASIVSVVDATTGIDALVRPGEKTWLIDSLDQRFVDLLENIKFWVPVTWRGGKLTTFCHAIHGVQNTWLIVLAFNGLAHAMQLRPGMVLRVPTRQAIDDSLKAMQPKRKDGAGSIVVI